MASLDYNQFTVEGMWRNVWHNFERLLNVIWQHKTESPSVKILVCCWTTPNHYMKQCWLIFSQGLKFSHEGSFKMLTVKISFQSLKTNMKNIFLSLGGEWVKPRSLNALQMSNARYSLPCPMIVFSIAIELECVDVLILSRSVLVLFLYVAQLANLWRNAREQHSGLWLNSWGTRTWMESSRKCMATKSAMFLYDSKSQKRQCVSYLITIRFCPIRNEIPLC